MAPTTNNPLPSRPHIVACVYDDALDSKRVFDDLLHKQCTNAGVMRLGLQGDASHKVVAACADDEAAALYSARLPWGPGTPIRLSDAVCTAIAARRAEGARLASTSTTDRFVRRNIAVTVPAPHV